MIPINLPQIGDEELDAVTKVMRSGILTSGLGAGPKVTEFEKKFAAFAGVKHAIAVNTGTAALHAAIVSVGVKPGDEVILPSFTFVATAEAVVMAGGKPVFVDIDPQTYNLSSNAVSKALTERTKAILPVDLYGLPADITPIKRITCGHSLAIVEDACQGHGAKVNGKSVGSSSDLACWSLYASKNMTTGEGGVVTTDNDEFAEIVKLVRTHGEKAKYSSIMLGYNYRMSEIQAAIGSVQLDKLPGFLSRRRQNAQELSAILQVSKRLQLPAEPKGFRHSWYLYTVRIIDAEKNERDQIINELRKAGVGSEAYYVNPIHKMPYYKENFGDFHLPETEEAANQVLSLPIHPGVTSKQIEFIGATLLGLLQ
jgi:dTDP-4-amino-4,6-dideoxygalactose transaminase